MKLTQSIGKTTALWTMAILLTSSFASWCPGQSDPGVSTSKEAAPSWVLLSEIHVKPDMRQEWYDLQKNEVNPAFKKAGVSERAVWETVVGDLGTYFSVVSLENFAQLDEPGAIRRALEPGRLQAREHETIDRPRPPLRVPDARQLRASNRPERPVRLLLPSGDVSGDVSPSELVSGDVTEEAEHGEHRENREPHLFLSVLVRPGPSPARSLAMSSEPARRSRIDERFSRGSARGSPYSNVPYALEKVSSARAWPRSRILISRRNSLP